MKDFIEFAVKQIIEEADRQNVRGNMLKTLGEADEQQLVSMLVPYVDRLSIIFVYKYKKPIILNYSEDVLKIVRELKKQLAVEIAKHTSGR